MANPLVTFAGTAIYVDAMILAAYLRSESPWFEPVRHFITRAVDPVRPIRLVTATLTADEVVFVLLQELLLDPPYGVVRSRSQYLADHPHVVQRLMHVVDPPLQALLDVTEVQPVFPEDITEMRREMLVSGTLPRDAIHVAVMRRLGIDAIASDDLGFERCAGITVYQP